MICTRCQKRPANVFITKLEDGKQINEGICLVCAKELGLPQIEGAIEHMNKMMEKMGVTPDEMESAMEELMNMESEMGENENDPNFSLGGAGMMPPELMNMMGEPSEETEQNSDEADDKDAPTDFQKMMRDKFKDLRNFMPGKTPSANSETENPKAKKQSEKALKFLPKFCQNLCDKAREGKLDNIIGRDKEITRAVQILSRRTKNNPCFIGEPGVGKTAIAEGIAQRIAAGDVPFNLKNKELWLLDLTSLVAGTQFRGQFESRIKGLLGEVYALGNIILFIDEIHTIIGTGDAEGAQSAANILKPALSRGEVQIIGATTFNEYRKHIEKDSALERRFQPIQVKEPTVEETAEVLLGIKKYYEQFHKVKVGDDIVQAAARLSERYITDRFLPDKAIDLLDEACVFCSNSCTELSEYQALLAKRKEIDQKLEEIYEITNELTLDQQKDIATIKSERARIEQRLGKLKPKVENLTVTLDHIARVIELWTGIPAKKVEQSEMGKIKDLEAALKKRVIGQDEAVELVAKAIKRNRMQISARRRPASFIFVGPTGVGKTELVKVLSKELFSDTEPLIRFDMTEFMEKHTVSKMLGSPPGYVGYEEAGQLTEKVRRRPYSVVLFDEIEKAHPDVLNILLQILDEGRVTDSQGRMVSFENTVIVMTSNAGSGSKTGIVGFGASPTDLVREKTQKALSDIMRPEFLARVDDIVVFNPLDKAALSQIAAILLDELKAPLAEKFISLKFDKKACDKLAELAFGGKFAGRDLTKQIRKEIEDKIADILVENAGIQISEIKISAGNDIIIKWA